MEKRDFMYMQGDTKEKDSRYGVLYRTPTEITDMKYFSIGRTLENYTRKSQCISSYLD